MRIIFVTKVTAVDKATTVAKDTTFLRQVVFVFRILSRSTELKFLIWTEDKIRLGKRVSPVNRAYMKRPSYLGDLSMSVIILPPNQNG